MAFLIDDILLAPIKGIVWIAEKIRDMALEELEDTPEKLKRELLDTQLLLETDQITEEEYKKREKDILERLSALKEKK
ncbi:gas vesicle protein GvpG [Candidatus Roizmanbacteria bacterium]|nr:gas vesicle protein GvpG [Candidatus Roizmanbacteria bacterium]